ncbi:hypothetical protein NQZ68_026987 [Dissostichus eleginoides]|nr:hypothetical protein NQZ68_026987 [Dissostichus eleginoides]
MIYGYFAHDVSGKIHSEVAAVLKLSRISLAKPDKSASRGSLDFLILPLSKNKGAEFLYLDVVISWGQESQIDQDRHICWPGLMQMPGPRLSTSALHPPFLPNGFPHFPPLHL